MDGDGDICKMSDEISDENVELDFHESTELSPLKVEEIPEFKMKLISKTELCEELEGGQRSNRFTLSITLLTQSLQDTLPWPEVSLTTALVYHR